MESDDIYKYLGLFVLVVFIVYVVISTMNFQLKMVEGFSVSDLTSSKTGRASRASKASKASKGGKDSTDQKASSTDTNQLPVAIKNNTDLMTDALLIDKYLTVYEDTIINLSDNIDTYILELIIMNAEPISANPGSAQSQTIMNDVNTARTFSDSLNHAIKFLDKQ